jgi:hypothetical protein
LQSKNRIDKKNINYFKIRKSFLDSGKFLAIVFSKNDKFLNRKNEKKKFSVFNFMKYQANSLGKGYGTHVA